MATERVANIGYFGLIKEVTSGTALTPTDYVPLYKESINTSLNLVSDSPIFGNRFETYQVLQGQRSHKGSVEVMAEPNTAGRIADMLLAKGTTTGADPYTHPYTLGLPNTYTCDISTGNVVVRYWGVGASSLSPSWDKNEMHFNIGISALGSFSGREIASVATTTLTLKTDYDPVPNRGLVVSDLVRIYKQSTGATLDTTIATVNVDGITVTLGASAAAFAAGDMIYLRPATPTLTLKTPFLWSKTMFGFATTAATALTNAVFATQTRVEQGSNWTINHKFESDDGAPRSGAFDPASLIRTTGNVDLKVKKFFDNPDDLTTFNNQSKQACVIRSYSGATNQYEIRMTFNHLKVDGKVTPDLSAGSVNYSELDYVAQYDSTDGQAFDLKVLNGLATI